MSETDYKYFVHLFKIGIYPKISSSSYKSAIKIFMCAKCHILPLGMFSKYTAVNTGEVDDHKNDFLLSNFVSIYIYVSLRLRVQNAVPAQPCVGKLGISLVLLNFLHCNFRLWFKTP